MENRPVYLSKFLNRITILSSNSTFGHIPPKTESKVSKRYRSTTFIAALLRRDKRWKQLSVSIDGWIKTNGMHTTEYYPAFIFCVCVTFIYLFFPFIFISWRLITILQWVLPYIDMNQPWIYMYSPSQSPLPPPSPPDPSGSSQCTSP